MNIEEAATRFVKAREHLRRVKKARNRIRYNEEGIPCDDWMFSDDEYGNIVIHNISDGSCITDNSLLPHQWCDNCRRFSKFSAFQRSVASRVPNRYRTLKRVVEREIRRVA